jgi:hypothetical protein
VVALTTATKRAFATSSLVKGPPSRNGKSRIFQNSPSVRFSDDAIRTPSR